LNSVQFSNHTGYPNGFKGERLNGDQLLELIDGLEANGLLDNYSHFITGYIGNPSFLENIILVLSRLKKVNPNLIYVCDPVMGDYSERKKGKAREPHIYVSHELPKLYRECVIPLAHLIVPNQLECELLTDMKINSLKDAAKACDVLHAMGIKQVVITSLEFGTNHIYVFGSEIMDSFSPSTSSTSTSSPSTSSPSTSSPSTSSPSLKTARFTIKLERIKGTFSGAGDLTSALLLAWSSPKLVNRSQGSSHPSYSSSSTDSSSSSYSSSSPSSSELKRACEKAVSSVQAVMRRTVGLGRRELALVQSKADIERPPPLSAHDYYDDDDVKSNVE